jgi:predicted PurR-regulated permease PerM
VQKAGKEVFMSDPVDSPASSINPIYRKRFALILLVILLAIFLRMISSLLLGVILGIILAVITRKVYLWFEKKTHGKRRAAAALSLLATILFVVIPVSFLAMLMFADGVKLANEANDWLKPYQTQLETTLDHFTYGGKLNLFGYEVEVGNVTQKVQESIGSIATFLVSLLQKTLGGLANVILLIFIALYTLYFFYLDGAEFWEWLKRMLPLKPEQAEKLKDDFLSTSLASIKTLGVIGLVQGLMGGLAFWVCGIPGPLFWSILMAVCSVIPLVGSQIILFPTAVILMLTGQVWWGIGLLAWSWIAIANVDNFLRPILIGKQTELHELVIFLSTIGGIAVYGFFGFLIGPVIAAMLKVAFEIYEDAFLTEDKSKIQNPKSEKIVAKA